MIKITYGIATGCRYSIEIKEFVLKDSNLNDLITAPQRPRGDGLLTSYRNLTTETLVTYFMNV